jgi:hypothetical protein
MRDWDQGFFVAGDIFEVFGGSFPVDQMIVAITVSEPCIDTSSEASRDDLAIGDDHFGADHIPVGVVIQEIEKRLEWGGDVGDVQTVEVMVDIFVKLGPFSCGVSPLTENGLSGGTSFERDLGGDGLGWKGRKRSGDELGHGESHRLVVQIISMRVGVETGGHYLV